MRRIYRHGAATVNVTLGVQGPEGEAAFAKWVSMSVTYPQIPLAAPADEANGFFDCKGERAPTCDGHIQFKNALHLELFGGGTASRDEVSLLLGGLPVEGMAPRRRFVRRSSMGTLKAVEVELSRCIARCSS